MPTTAKHQHRHSLKLNVQPSLREATLWGKELIHEGHVSEKKVSDRATTFGACPLRTTSHTYSLIPIRILNLESRISGVSKDSIQSLERSARLVL